MSLLPPDFQDIIGAFQKGDVRFLLIGAYAMARYVEPRSTGDIDLWIDSTPDNAVRVFDALSDFGAPLTGVRPADFEAERIVFQFGVTPVRIDILTTIEEVEFGEAWKKREQLEVDGFSIPVLSREHLIQNKRALGRFKDLADIEALEANE